MIIKCIKEKIYKNGKKDEFLILGKEYIAYSIGYNNNKEIVYDIIFCQHIMPYKAEYIISHFKTEYFEVVDDRIPNDYIIRIKDNEFFINPKEFEDGSLENFYDGDPEAVKAIENLTKRIKEFHNWQSEEDKKAIEEEKNKDPYAWPYSDDVW